MGIYSELSITKPVAEGLIEACTIQDRVALDICVQCFGHQAAEYIARQLEEDDMLVQFKDVGSTLCWDYTQGEKTKRYTYQYEGFKNAIITQLLAFGADAKGIECALETIKNRIVQ